MNTFSFQAKDEADVEAFEALCKSVNYEVKVAKTLPTDEKPEVGVEVETVQDLGDMRAIMRNIPDSTMMIQTSRACILAENNLELDLEAR